MSKGERRLLVTMISVMAAISMFQFIDDGCCGESSGYHIWVGSVDLSGDEGVVTIHVAVFDEQYGLPEGTVGIEGIGYVVKDDGLRAYAPISGVGVRTIAAGTTYVELTFTLPPEQNIHLLHAVYTPNGGDEVQSMTVYPIGV